MIVLRFPWFPEDPRSPRRKSTQVKTQVWDGKGSPVSQQTSHAWWVCGRTRIAVPLTTTTRCDFPPLTSNPSHPCSLFPAALGIPRSVVGPVDSTGQASHRPIHKLSCRERQANCCHRSCVRPVRPVAARARRESVAATPQTDGVVCVRNGAQRLRGLGGVLHHPASFIRKRQWRVSSPTFFREVLRARKATRLHGHVRSEMSLKLRGELVVAAS